MVGQDILWFVTTCLFSFDICKVDLRSEMIPHGDSSFELVWLLSCIKNNKKLVLIFLSVLLLFHYRRFFFKTGLKLMEVIMCNQREVSAHWMIKFMFFKIICTYIYGVQDDLEPNSWTLRLFERMYIVVIKMIYSRTRLPWVQILVLLLSV